MKNLIDFIFIGPSKTASTWIYKFLDEHPDVDLPNFKESYFFDKYYSKGVKWYESLFAKCDSSKITGEISHDYILKSHYLGNDINAIERISIELVDVKLMCCLRNPFERTLSGYFFLRRNGYVYNNLIEATQAHSELIEGSLYGKNLENVLSYFRKEKILLLEFEQLSIDPVLFANSICDFLHIPMNNDSEILNSVVNSKRKSRNVFLSKLSKKIILYLRNLGLGSLVTRLKSNSLVLNLLFKEDNSSYSLSSTEYEYLKEVFLDDIKKLNGLFGRDFSSWIADAKNYVK